MAEGPKVAPGTEGYTVGQRLCVATFGWRLDEMYGAEMRRAPHVAGMTTRLHAGAGATTRAEQVAVVARGLERVVQATTRARRTVDVATRLEKEAEG